MRRVKCVIEAKLLLVQRADRSAVAYLLGLYLLALGYVLVSSVGVVRRLGDNGGVIWACIVAGLMAVILLGIPSAARQLFRSRENSLLLSLPLTKRDFVLVKALENVFWHLVLLFPIGCALVISHTIAFSRPPQLLIIRIPLWFLLSIGVALSQTSIAVVTYPIVRRCFRGDHRRRAKRKFGSWLLVQNRFPFLHRRKASVVIKDIVVESRHNRLDIISLAIITLVAGLFMAAVSSNLTSGGDWDAVLNMQIFFSIPILLLWSGTALSFPVDEVRWLLRVLPLSAKELHGAKFAGRFLFLFTVLSASLLPSTVMIVVAGGIPVKTYAFTTMVSLFLSLWSTSIVYLVFPRVSLGTKVYYLTAVVGLILFSLFPPALPVGILLAWRFSRIGIRKLAEYQFR